MRHYVLVPVRYNAQQLLARCEPIDAELWSIQWHYFRDDVQTDSRTHWVADFSPLELDNAEAIVTWLNNREQFAATLPPLSDVRPFDRWNRSK